MGQSPKIKEIWEQIVTEGSLRPEMSFSMLNYYSDGLADCLDHFSGQKHGFRQLDGQNWTIINEFNYFHVGSVRQSGLVIFACNGL